MQPLAELMASLPQADDDTPLDEWLHSYYEAFLAPLISDDAGLAELMRIYGREMSGEATASFDEACCAIHRAPAPGAGPDAGPACRRAQKVDEQIHQLGVRPHGPGL